MAILLEKQPFWVFDCGGCESKVAAEITDVYVAVFGAAYYAGDNGEVKYYVSCPNCGHDNILPHHKVTDKVKATAKEYQYGQNTEIKPR